MFPVSVAPSLVSLALRVVPFCALVACCAAASAAVLGTGDNVARGRPYEWSRPPDYPLCTDPGDRTQLTDGELSERQWWDKRMVGWEGSANLTLTLDLGEVLPIGAVRVRFGSARGNVFCPLWLYAFTSDDRQQWFPAGRVRYEEILGELREAPYQLLSIDGLKAAGRYVALVMRPQGQFTMLDEVEVIRGAHAVAGAARNPNAALARPEVVDLYFREEAYVCPDFALPLNFQRSLSRAGGSGIDLYLPDGVTVAAADTEPSEKAFAPVPAGARGRRVSYPRSLGVLFLRTTWKPGQVGELAIAAQAGVQRVRLASIDMPKAKRPRRLLVDVDWVEVAYKRRWPGFFDLWEHVGLNTVSLAKSDTARPAPDAEIDGFVAEARRRGFHVAANYSPFYEALQRASAQHPEPQRLVGLDGRTSKTMCPRLYFRDHYQPELDDINRGVGHGVSWFWLDFEPEWGASQPCFCPGCKREFAEFLKAAGGPAYGDPQEVEKAPEKHAPLHQAWEAFQGGFGEQITRRIRGAIEAEASRRKVAAAPRFMLGYYDLSPLWEAERGRFYHNFLSFTGLHAAGLVEMGMPSLYYRTREAAGDAVRLCREKMGPGCVLMPWQGINLGGDEWRYVLLESFANGATGFTYFTARYMDGRDYRTIAAVLRAVEPVEDLIADGELLRPADAKVEGHGRVAGLRRGGETLLLVTNYWDLAKGPVTVRLPGLEQRTVTDLETGERIASREGSLTVPLTAERRARLLWVR